MNMNNKLKYARQTILHLTQRELATILNVTSSTILSWEKGTTRPCLHHIVKISSLSHTSIDYFLKNGHPLEICCSNISSDSFYLLRKVISNFESINERRTKK